MQPSSEVVAAASPELPLEVSITKDEDYPEELTISPFDIASFIRQHPVVNLESLWQRLRINGDDRSNEISFGDTCGNCEANIFEYNLDRDAARELVLKINEPLGQVYRYLVFKDPRDGPSKFLGHIDVWAKYPPADPVVLMSNGRAWLIVQSTAATGSGLGAWLDTVYDISNGRVRAVGSYLAQVNQSGHLNFPTKTFVGSPVSCEFQDGKAILTVAYTVEYSAYSDRQILLFTKHQKAVLRGLLKDRPTSLDAAKSEVSPGEFDTIYNFDSMHEEDFLKYNHSELRAIARGNNSEKKQWLKEFLETCANDPIKRELSALLR